MLLAIKEFLQTHQSANLEEMARYVNQDPGLTRELLQHWIRKGKVVRLSNPVGCGTRCVQCQPGTAEVYQWVEKSS